MGNFLKIKEIIKVLLPRPEIGLRKENIYDMICMVENFIVHEVHVMVIKHIMDYSK